MSAPIRMVAALVVTLALTHLPTGTAAATPTAAPDDRQGNVVGADQPQALTDADEGNPGFTDCNTPLGIRFLHFSALLERCADRASVTS